MRVKEETEKPVSKLNIQKTKIMVSSPITSWQIDGGKVETVSDFTFLASKLAADSDCSHKISKMLALWKKSSDKPGHSIKKQGNSRKTTTSASLTTLKPLTVWITANWKILKEMRIPDNLILLRNLYAGQEATV